ncbi:hypothetical protein [Paracoccus sp. SCSIO 75233]|uniref:hypothetical protein n=1 Tax=Paracoccus sp. SCSIO 75233 TaxID=3017782 RepID=UPI0022F11BF6|nr:hypothetical protein [Paracoccus sp. SCSIO 75233]WBU55353.1 hypothetical protein PAF12_18600 [Paracoccus sp. SCSIO 75233]
MPVTLEDQASTLSHAGNRVSGFGVALLGIADPDIFSEKAHESTVAGMFRFNRNITAVDQNNAVRKAENCREQSCDPLSRGTR